MFCFVEISTCIYFENVSICKLKRNFACKHKQTSLQSYCFPKKQYKLVARLFKLHEEQNNPRCQLYKELMF
jgi:hypothetical protein